MGTDTMEAMKLLSAEISTLRHAAELAAWLSVTRINLRAALLTFDNAAEGLDALREDRDMWKKRAESLEAKCLRLSDEYQQLSKLHDECFNSKSKLHDERNIWQRRAEKAEGLQRR